MVSDKLVNIIEQIGEKRFEHIQHMKAFAIKSGKCKETIGGKCTYPHCQCLFVGLEEGDKDEKTGA